MTTKPIHMIGADASAMQRICKRIAAKRQEEANTLPPLEHGYQPPHGHPYLGRGQLHAALALLILGTLVLWVLGVLISRAA